MGRWFRFYDDAINDPKILKLPEASRWHWTALLCIASKNDGFLPATEDVALMLRVKTAAAAAIIATMKAAGLLDLIDGRFSPHNWSGRQYKSDVSTERVKRFRKRERNVSETPPDTDTDTDTETEHRQKDAEAKASGADAPRDVRSELFGRGLATLARLTGKGPDACRSFVGKCLKAASDDAVTVLGLIEDAERNRVVDPSAWIAARLKSTGPPVKPQTVHQIERQTGREILDDIDRFISSSGGQANSGLLRHDPGNGPESIRGRSGGDVIELPSGRAGKSS